MRTSGSDRSTKLKQTSRRHGCRRPPEPGDPRPDATDSRADRGPPRGTRRRCRRPPLTASGSFRRRAAPHAAGHCPGPGAPAVMWCRPAVGPGPGAQRARAGLRPRAATRGDTAAPDVTRGFAIATVCSRGRWKAGAGAAGARRRLRPGRSPRTEMATSFNRGRYTELSDSACTAGSETAALTARRSARKSRGKAW